MACDCSNKKHTHSEEADKIYRYRVQVGQYSNYNKAMDLQLQLFGEGWMSDIDRQGDMFVVSIGDYLEVDKAAFLELYLRYYGYNTFVIAV